jgi:hypothetical protein
MFIAQDVTGSPENSWSTINSFPKTSYYMSATAVDGKIYVMGRNYLYMYDASANSWIEKTPMPLPSGEVQNTRVAMVAYEHKIYFFGLGYQQVSYYWVFDTTTDSWSPITPDPIIRRGASACLVNGKIYVLGGGFSDAWTIGSYNSNEMFDPSTGNWVTLSSIPEDIGLPVSVVVDDEIYVFGGNHNVQIYNPQTNQWRTSSSTGYLSGGYDTAAATSGLHAPKKIYLFGSGYTIVFNPETETWGNGTAQPERVGLLTATVENDVFYVVDCNYYQSVNHCYTYTPIGYSDSQTTSAQTQSWSTSIFVIALTAAIIASVVAGTTLLILHIRRKPNKKTAQST